MVVEILLIYITYLTLLLLGSYYVNLYISKDQFTKEELKDILPYLTKFKNNVMNNYSMLILVACLGVSSLLGIVLPMISEIWFFNSSIIFIVMFFAFPQLKNNFEKAQVSTGGDMSDTAMHIFMKYYNFILIGFGTGTATGLMYNWGVYKAIHFLWFIINFIVLSVLIGIAIKNAAKE